MASIGNERLYPRISGPLWLLRWPEVRFALPSYATVGPPTQWTVGSRVIRRQARASSMTLRTPMLRLCDRLLVETVDSLEMTAKPHAD
jgi:hypothetical protein